VEKNVLMVTASVFPMPKKNVLTAMSTGMTLAETGRKNLMSVVIVIAIPEVIRKEPVMCTDTVPEVRFTEFMITLTKDVPAEVAILIGIIIRAILSS
jgi:hypothetical protein